MVTDKIMPTRHAHGTKTGKIIAGIIIISDSLYESIQRNSPKEDVSGKLCEQLLKDDGITVLAIEVVPDVVYEIRSAFLRLLKQVHLLITIGGTGSTPRDVTIESVALFTEKKLDGFGELFREKSYPEIGNATILSRAFLGIVEKTIICCLPGSPHAVKLGLTQILLPELRHLLKHIGA